MTGAPEGAESITEAELAAAFGRLPLPGLYDGGKMAASLVADVLAHREPEYEPGGIYLSPDGCRYMRLDGPPSGCWMELHANGSTSHRGDGRPERPLRKLVPEGPRDGTNVKGAGHG